MTTYYIQRGLRKDRGDKKGIDSILSLDYMDCAEYEFGALPKSLAQIRENINDYVYLDVPLKEKVITVFCKNEHKTKVKQYLTSLCEGEMRLKAYSGFNMFMEDKERIFTKVDFWWDIQNHIMFWEKDGGFESKFKAVITYENT